jgi:hypothetical protein
MAGRQHWSLSVLCVAEAVQLRLPCMGQEAPGLACTGMWTGDGRGYHASDVRQQHS